TPRKLGVPGESLPKVMYRLLEPENFAVQKVLVVGGGDSAIEASVALSCQEGTSVTLSYRGPVFARIKPDNQRRIQNAAASGKVNLLMESNVRQIKERSVEIDHKGNLIDLANDSVFIFAGGELPNEFLKACGIKMDTLYGDSMKKMGAVRQKNAD
ncbi:MAG: NAD(P)-binding domain-containing protein, partial [Nitrospinae bacterium]|nr:NAD(P)-binding domain-containing protein [Nitrospinota bacterium]